MVLWSHFDVTKGSARVSEHISSEQECLQCNCFSIVSLSLELVPLEYLSVTHFNLVSIQYFYST
jgi:hypothetical protein